MRLKAFLTTLIIVLTTSCASPNSNQLIEAAALIKPTTRVAAPNFELKNLAGKNVSLFEFRGKVVLLHFWATWCRSCRVEMPVLEELTQKFAGEDFVVLAISVDRGSSKIVKKVASGFAVSFPVLLDPSGEVRKNYEITALPTSYLIGKDGKLSAKQLGAASWSSAKHQNFIEKLLAE